MKKIYFLFFAFLFCLAGQKGFSQKIGDLKGIYYQAVAVDDEGKEIVGTDVEGKPLYEKTIGVRFSITKGLNGAVQWEETHETTTDKYGLFTLIIGQGTPTGNGPYAKLLDIPWIDADQFLKVEIATKNDGNYKIVSNQQFMAVPYSFYTDDIADNAVTTDKILDSTIINQDIHSGAVDSRTILDSTIVNRDLHTGSVDSRVILNETILSEDIATGAVTTSEILDSTIINTDLHTGSVDSRVILDETILAEDIATGAVTSSEILDSTIINEDIQTGAIDTRTILNGTIVNEDIANGTIDLTTKVTGALPIINGGTGNTSFITDNLLVGNGTNPLKSKILACRDSSIAITQTADSIILKTTYVGTEVTSDPAGTFVIGNLPNGSTYVSNAINSFAVAFGDIVVGSVNVNLQGCMMTCYVSQPNVIRVAIYNGTGSAVNLGTVDFRVYIIH